MSFGKNAIYEIPIKSLEAGEHQYNQLSKSEEVRDTIYAEWQNQYVEPEGVYSTKPRSTELEKHSYNEESQAEGIYDTVYEVCYYTENVFMSIRVYYCMYAAKKK